jgi:hypothetical protein
LYLPKKINKTMKKHFRIFAAFLTLALLISVHTVSMAQPPPPPPGGGHGLPGNQPPANGAPIGNGTFILLTLAAAYALRKVYVMRATTAAAEE